ncbi:LexA family protein [Pelagibaculum spongiae]|uniref:DNA polymerase V n=1 Tax=Pelagibaculum spongiae TaxID=2080658 RepID=A0A2V1GTR6_9GAMM|nr:translesion error-prone DNA polymerase V autoproteolytic subunit [Pelagibaculum spongiae]PVZ69008.1 DNA polymerase V [Pelagibaculum spongiae]
MQQSLPSSLQLPLLGFASAGFPSPAADYQERTLDLSQHLIQHPSSSFFMQADGHSMQGVGIFDQDLLLVDRSLTAQQGDVVIAEINGSLLVKQLCYHKKQPQLRSTCDSYPAIPCNPEQIEQIWGVVTSVIHSLRPSCQLANA